MDLTHIPDVDVNKQKPVSAGRKIGELIMWRLRLGLWTLPFSLWYYHGIGAALGGTIVVLVLWMICRSLWHRLTHRSA